LLNFEEEHARAVSYVHTRTIPMPEAVRLAFDRAVVLARKAGASFRPGEVHVYCYRGSEGYREPSVTFFRDRPVLIYLNLAISFDDDCGLVWHIAHELAHAFYDPRDVASAPWERERRANAFASSDGGLVINDEGGHTKWSDSRRHQTLISRVGGCSKV